MEFDVHHQVLLSVLVLAMLFGAVANKTHFCTLGAVSDWVNIGDTGRMRAWVFAMAVALAGVLAMEAFGFASISGTTFPHYRTPVFAWMRYLLGGFMFGVGMTLASGCSSKTLIRVGGGNLKSAVVLAVAALCAYAMIWTELYAVAFNPWLAPTAVDLQQHAIRSQALGDVIAHIAGGEGRVVGSVAGWVVVAAFVAFAFASRDFRGSFDNVLGGFVVGLIIAAGWYVTGGPLGAEWKDYAAMSAVPPSRVEVQSFTFIAPMGDTLRYLMSPASLELINFGVVALGGVLIGSFLYALAARRFRIEWFASLQDVARHLAGGALLGIGGVVAMGCTIGQAITGTSTLALGSFLTFAAIVAGSVATMKFQYWLMMREEG
jgi:uncharacterized membrane protein YedE/YeeE